MTHEIESDDMVLTTEGIVPWHGLGITIPGRANAEKALTLAKLAGWNLTKQPVFVNGSEVPHYFGIERQTDGKVLGIVQDRYTILPNEQAFDWANFLVGGDGFHFTTAGSLRGGKIVFLTLSTPFKVDLPNGDRLETYLLIQNRHDGSGSVIAAIVTIRVVCKNTLDMALGGAVSSYKIRHTVTMEGKLAEAQKVLGLAQGAADRAEDVATRLLNAKMSSAKFDAFLNLLVPIEDLEKRSLTMANKTRELISDVYFTHPTQADIKGTAWGAYNATTFYNDHLIPRRETDEGKPAENRMLAILAGNNLGTKALSLLTQPPFMAASKSSK